MGGRIQSRIQERRAESWKAEAKRLRTQLDQERQRREQAEGLLREIDKRHLTRDMAVKIDKHFGEWDGRSSDE